MSKDMLMIFMIAFALFAMQGIGGLFQIKDYRKSIRRVHKYGNVGIGQKRGRFFNGNLVLIASDNSGNITRVEVMEGLTFLSKFKEKETLLDKDVIDMTIYDFLELFRGMTKKKQKFYKGYIQALEALELRFQDKAEETPDTAAEVSAVS